jgi:formylglycine-generating enzyme required for sulfatase activity
MKNIKILMIIVISVLCLSCNDEIEQVNGTTKIVKFEKDTVDKSDKVILYGEFLNVKPQNSFILIGAQIKILSSQVSIWNNSRIEFVAPDTSGIFDVRLVLGADTTNSIKLSIRNIPVFDMVEIPAGSFNMGALSGLDDEEPVHNVNITKILLCSKYEISQKLWLSLMKNNPSFEPNIEYPVNNIEWESAIEFCNKLSVLMNLDTCYTKVDNVFTMDMTAKGYRLPTEAEWEYLCRAGTNSDYAGDGELEAMGWYNLNSGITLHKSGLKNANDFGLYDMHGNLAEWCWDNYSSEYYLVSPADNPTGSEIESSKCIRGGSFNNGSQKARAASRDTSSIAQKFIGFRIVRNK